MRKEVVVKNGVSVGPYSQGIDAGELVFLSGQTPINPKTGKLVETGIADQTKQCFENLFKVLESIGLTPDDVVKVNVYLTDINNFEEMNKVYADQFNKPYPARTTIAVAGLPLNADIEIEMIAKKK